jgi:hypothetical protein
MFDAVETKEKNHDNLIYRLSGAAGVRLAEELFHPATILSMNGMTPPSLCHSFPLAPRPSMTPNMYPDHGWMDAMRCDG